MIKQKFEILNIEEKYPDSYPKEIRYEKNRMNLRFHNFGEIRMGLDACQIEVFRNEKKIDNIFKNDYLVTIPSNYEPFSPNGLYGFIPTCPLYKEKLVILNTNDLSKIHLESIEGGVLGNCFSKSNDNELIIVSTKKIYWLNISKSIIKPLDYDFDWPDFPTVYWSNKSDLIIIIENKSKKTNQNIIAYNIINDTKDIAKLKKPSDVFDFKIHTFKELTKKKEYCLFRGGTSTVGYLLDKWDNIKKDIKSESLIASTLIPISEIYYNEKWSKKGCDVKTEFAKIEILIE